jgi:PTS system nitrogen regulatory IIA component
MPELKVDPLFRNLHGDRRFGAMLARMKLADWPAGAAKSVIGRAGNPADYARSRALVPWYVFGERSQAMAMRATGGSVNTIASLLQVEDVVLDLAVADKPALLDAIGRHMEHSRGFPHEGVTRDLSRREQVGSTGLGQGVAIPHARFGNLDRILIAYLRLKPPIAYDAPDGKPVTDILVVLVPKQAAEEHLSILAEATRMFADRGFRERLRQCANPLEVKRTFDAWV